MHVFDRKKTEFPFFCFPYFRVLPPLGPSGKWHLFPWVARCTGPESTNVFNPWQDKTPECPLTTLHVMSLSVSPAVCSVSPDSWAMRCRQVQNLCFHFFGHVDLQLSDSNPLVWCRFRTQQPDLWFTPPPSPACHPPIAGHVTSEDVTWIPLWGHVNPNWFVTPSLWLGNPLWRVTPLWLGTSLWLVTPTDVWSPLTCAPNITGAASIYLGLCGVNRTMQSLLSNTRHLEQETCLSLAVWSVSLDSWALQWRRVPRFCVYTFHSFPHI